MSLRIGSLCSGYSGLEMGVQSVIGGEVAWQSDIDPGACKILAHRYPGVPNIGDMTIVNWTQVEPVDVITGGTPCQDVSAAGKRAGMRAGTRSGLWSSMCDAVDIIRPGLVVWENVRGVLSAHADSAVEPCPICVGDERDAHLRALGRVVGDLSELGYVGRWTGLRAADVGAPHGRFRVFVVAWPAVDTHGARLEGRGPGGHGAQRPEPVRAADAAADAPRDGQHERRPEPARLIGRPDAAVSGAGADMPAPCCCRLHGGECCPTHSAADTASNRRPGRAEAIARGRSHGSGPRSQPAGSVRVEWGTYGPAVARWERALGRPAPSPTEPGRNGQPRLSPAFVEWLMGLPAGWVTDVPGLTRNEQLKALGNGVVSQQCAAALRLLLADQLRAAA